MSLLSTKAWNMQEKMIAVHLSSIYWATLFTRFIMVSCITDLLWTNACPQLQEWTYTATCSMGEFLKICIIKKGLFQNVKIEISQLYFSALASVVWRHELNQHRKYNAYVWAYTMYNNKSYHSIPLFTCFIAYTSSKIITKNKSDRPLRIVNPNVQNVPVSGEQHTLCLQKLRFSLFVYSNSTADAI